MTENKRFNTVHKQMANVLGYECVFDDLENKWLFIRDVIILVNKLNDENEELKEEIKDLRINVLDSIHKADEIQCTCNPCIMEECVKRVVE